MHLKILRIWLFVYCTYSVYAYTLHCFLNFFSSSWCCSSCRQFWDEGNSEGRKFAGVILVHQYLNVPMVAFSFMVLSWLTELSSSLCGERTVSASSIAGESCPGLSRRSCLGFLGNFACRSPRQQLEKELKRWNLIYRAGRSSQSHRCASISTLCPPSWDWEGLAGLSTEVASHAWSVWGYYAPHIKNTSFMQSGQE